jgi:dethiobiotin synthetase
MRGYFVTGTDTGIGKTTCAVALIHALQQQGLQVAAMKPVAAGGALIGGQLLNEDVLALRNAANVKVDLHNMNPYRFAAPIAPHIAAAQAGVEIKLDKIVSAYAALTAQADAVVVEDAGGFLVPLGAQMDTADLALALDLPVILVVGMRLGCLNHALLTAEAIAHRGLKWAGWIANILEPDMPALAENMAALEARLPAPCLGRLGAFEQTARSRNDAGLTMQWSAAFAKLDIPEPGKY